ncbi:VOC family protein [Pelomicrobium sp.]|jgi:catechol 2,3-dioxygenase-like lactoylglutathione lyase family enzyme|uniref:VOC family protein n=1 Tax=Pelomicrobium sp. TaxID=2815319 RepID=UPI002FDDEB50
MTIQGLDHFTVLTEDLETTRRFYAEVLGLREGERPPFGFPGAWFYCRGRPVLHVIAGRDLPAQRSGVIDHMAFSATNKEEWKAKLQRHGIPFDLRRQPGTGVWQMFFLDPNGAKVELDFGDEPEKASAGARG